MKIFLVVAMSLVFTSTAFGQGTFIIERAKGKSIPDPESVLALASLLANQSVVKELGLDEETTQGVKQLLSTGSLTLYSTRDDVGREELLIRLEAYKADNLERLYTLLDPNQLLRLKQIAYHVEIQRVGLVRALTEGCLGEAIKIENSEKSGIMIRSEAADRDLLRDTEKSKRTVWQPLIDILTETQKEALQTNTGRMFIFTDEPYLNTDTEGFVVPNPDDSVALVELIRNRSVANELSVDTATLKELEEIYKENRGFRSKLLSGFKGDEIGRLAAIKSVRDVGETVLLRILSKESLKRLREVAYQIEIERIGLSKAMLVGRLERVLQLSSSQKDSIKGISEKVEQELRTEISKLRLKHVEKILAGLEPRHLVQAKSVLGSKVWFKEDAVPIPLPVPKINAGL